MTDLTRRVLGQLVNALAPLTARDVADRLEIEGSAAVVVPSLCSLADSGMVERRAGKVRRYGVTEHGRKVWAGMQTQGLLGGERCG